MSRGECPNPRPECPYAELQGGCFSDEHHLFYPRVDYRDIIGSEFRELPENKEQICRWDHDERHATEPIPDRPSREEMLGAIVTAMANGEIYLSKTKRKKLNVT